MTVGRGFLPDPSPTDRPGGKPPCVRRRGRHAGQARAGSPPNIGEGATNLNDFHGNLSWAPGHCRRRLNRRLAQASDRAIFTLRCNFERQSEYSAPLISGVAHEIDIDCCSAVGSGPGVILAGTELATRLSTEPANRTMVRDREGSRWLLVDRWRWPGPALNRPQHVHDGTKQPPAEAGGFVLRTESPDTRRLNDASYSGSILKSSSGFGSK